MSNFCPDQSYRLIVARPLQQSKNSSAAHPFPLDGSIGCFRDYPQGAVVWSATEPVHSLFMILRGEVEISVLGYDSHETVLRFVKPGELCGLLSFCEQKARRAHSTARATAPTAALELSRDQV